MGRFVRPEIVRLKLSGGDYIDVKKELNTGEERRVFARMARDMTPGQRAKLDPEQVGMARVLEFLIGWSFVDDDGKPVELPEASAAKQAVLENLSVDSFSEIRDAIDAHEEALAATREKEKKDSGEIKSAVISPSPSAAGGAMSGLQS